LNKKVITYAAYNAALISHNILVQAKNFLVFQGDVETVASQSPHELSQSIERISGSLELAFESTKEAQERVTKKAFNFKRWRGITGEIKWYKEQKTEAVWFEAICQEWVCYIIIFRAYNADIFLGPTHPRTYVKSWKTNIRRGLGLGVFILPPQLLDRSMIFSSSRLQVEVEEKLHNIYHQLLQAGVKRQKSEKETKMKETIANLQRIFPGA